MSDTPYAPAYIAQSAQAPLDEWMRRLSGALEKLKAKYHLYHLRKAFLNGFAWAGMYLASCHPLRHLQIRRRSGAP